MGAHQGGEDSFQYQQPPAITGLLDHERYEAASSNVGLARDEVTQVGA